MKFCDKINQMLSPNIINFFVLYHYIISDVLVHYLVSRTQMNTEAPCMLVGVTTNLIKVT